MTIMNVHDIAMFGAAILCILSIPVECTNGCDEKEEQNARQFLREFEQVAKEFGYSFNLASWKHSTNLTDYNRNQMLKENNRYLDGIAAKVEEGAGLNQSALCKESTRTILQKVLSYRRKEQESNKTKEMRNKEARVIAEMTEIYSSAKVCLDVEDTKTCLSLDPGILDILRKSKDANLRLRAWKGWRNESGKKMRKLFAEYVELSNNLLKQRNSSYEDHGQSWRSDYDPGDGSNFERDVEALLQQARPLFQNVLAFVRRRLRTMFPAYKFPNVPLIPAHLAYATNVEKELLPFPDNPSINITHQLHTQNYSVEDMFRTAEDFFTSLNLTAMTDEFWKYSMFVKPTDGRNAVCHASAWDMGNGNDYRIKMCTSRDQSDFITIHHELGHIEYYLQYRDQPYVNQEAPNPGFHEAIGDTLALSVETTKHLKTIGLLDRDFVDNNETDINFLMSMALDKIVRPPYFYVIDRFRWDVFKGLVTPDNYTKHWWNLRCKYQGLLAPVERTEEDFDPGAIYHVSSDSQTINYFVSYILQFQFYEALCNATNHTGPLYKCDFYNNTLAGKKLGDMMKVGSSLPWPDVLYKMTGSRKLDMGPLMRYFEPLKQYLERVNTDEELSWDDHCDTPSLHRQTSDPPTAPMSTSPAKSKSSGNSKTTPGGRTTTDGDDQGDSASSWMPGRIGIMAWAFAIVCVHWFV